MSFSNWLDPTLLLLVALGVSLLRASTGARANRAGKRARTAAWLAWSMLWLSATPILDDACARALEWPATDPVAAARGADRSTLAIVVLGAGLKTDAEGVPLGERQNASGTARIVGGARLFRALGPSLVVLSGGAAREAESSLDAALSQGIPRDRIVVEGASANTHENATASAAVLEHAHAKTVVLVTSALHMRRSMIEFERAGLHPIAAPVDYVSASHATLRDFFPRSSGALKAALLAHEMYGLVGTWLKR